MDLNILMMLYLRNIIQMVIEREESFEESEQADHNEDLLQLEQIATAKNVKCDE